MTAPIRPHDLTNAAPLRGPGRRLPQTLAALDQRDALLREAAVSHFPDTSANAAAGLLFRALDRYRCCWQRERAEPCPRHRVGRLDGHCWLILKAHDAAVSARTIRRILKAPIRGQQTALQYTVLKQSE